MDRRPLVAVAFAILLSLAGCAGFFGGGDATPTPTPEPGPFADVSFPNGTDVDGITDRSALLEGHRSIVNASSYEVSYTVDIRQGQTTVARRTVGTRSALDARRAYSVVSEPGRLAEAYRNETTVVTREYRGNTSEYRVHALDRSYPAEHARIAGTETIDLVLQNGHFSADAVLERRDGTTLVRYTLAEPNVSESANVSFAEGSLFVEESGVVHSAILRIEGTNQGARYIVNLRYSLVRLDNVTVQRPGWVDDAIATSE